MFIDQLSHVFIAGTNQRKATFVAGLPRQRANNIIGFNIVNAKQR